LAEWSYTMKKFNVKVNGIAYEVEVEELGGAVASAPVAAPAAAPAPAPQAAPAPVAAPAAAAAPSAAGSVKITAPMPGSILAVNVNAGETVTKGQVLVILEAMKMENEILAPQDGVVASVAVKKGDSVNSNDLLVSLN
jgi:biotin carboxyl carrier protein